jgi:hypothetical protein
MCSPPQAFFFFRRIGARPQQHFALAGKVAGRIAGGALGPGDFAAGGLSFGHQFEQASVQIIQAQAQLVQAHVGKFRCGALFVAAAAENNKAIA